MRILITGAGGQLGKELINQLNNKDIIPTYREELDITDINKVNEVLLYIKPEVVINCAAHTAVDLCESDIDNAYRINALGPKNLAIICEKIGAKLVQVSTDYVFDGKLSRPYREDDIPCPNSVYGSSKLLGENYVRGFSSKYFIIRTSWLYGDGNNFIKTMMKLSKNNKEINVVKDQIGSPTSTVDLAKVIIDLINTQYYGTYHGTCEGQCSWYEFAKEIFRLKNIDIKVNPITTAEYKTIAPRPAYSVLDNFMLKLINMNTFRNWQDSLKEYLENINL